MRTSILRVTRADGFTLVEALVAMTILVVGLVALASLSTIAARANTVAKSATFASLLAAQKMEQLLALTWGYDAQGHPISDTTTDLTVFPPGAGSGVGLTVSTVETLRLNTIGYSEFLDTSGTSLGGGTTAPPQAMFVRRWSIQALPSNPANALVIQVVVASARRASTTAIALPDEAALVSVRTRTGT